MALNWTVNQFNNYIDSILPDNQNRDISEADLRDALKNTVLRNEERVAAGEAFNQYLNGIFVERSLTLNAIVYINGTTGNDANYGQTAALAVKTFARAIALYSNKAVNLTIFITGTVEISANMAIYATNIWFAFAADGKILIRKLASNNGNYCLWLGALNIQFMTQLGGMGVVETEAHGGNITSLSAVNYNNLQGGIRLLKMPSKELRSCFKIQMIGLNNMKLTAGANTTIFAAHEEGTNLVPYNHGSYIFYEQMYNDPLPSGAAFDIGFNGNKVFIRNYTPTSSTDINVLEGETVSDNSFLYRKNGGFIKKIAWTTF